MALSMSLAVLPALLNCLAVCLCRLMQQSSSCDLLPLSPPALPETAGTGDTELLHLARAEADRATTALTDDGPHTCFDARLGPRFRGKFAHWDVEDCRLDCELTATYIPFPAGRVVHPVEGLFCPQTIVMDRRLQPTHRSLVLDLRAVGLHVTTIDVHQDSFLYEVTGALDTDTRRRLQEIFAGRIGHRFFVNGVLCNVAARLPVDTDVICVFPPAVAGAAPEQADMAEAVWNPDLTTLYYLWSGQP